MINWRRVRLLALASLLLATAAGAQGPTISINSIEENRAISGTVTGLGSGEAATHKVVVYVHTDKWYIHPFAGDVENKSWAAIRPAGTWSISTVRREFPADQIAVFVVDKKYDAPATLQNLQVIPSKASQVKDLKGTKDYRKL